LLGVPLASESKPLWAYPGMAGSSGFDGHRNRRLPILRTATTPILTAAKSPRAKPSVGQNWGGKQSRSVTHRISTWKSAGPRREHCFTAEGRDLAKLRAKVIVPNGSTTRTIDDRGRVAEGDVHARFYHHGGRPRPETVSPQQIACCSPHNIWQLELSAKEFSQLIAGAANAAVGREDQTITLLLMVTFDDWASRLVKAHAEVGRADLHPIEQALLIERGGEVREYRRRSQL